MTYRDDLKALRHRRENIEENLRENEADLSRVKARIEQERTRRKLPTLNDVKIASPCSESWAAMIGNDAMRFCGKCQKNVYNVAAMPREDAEQLIRDNEEGVCLRLFRRRDGTIITADCPVGRRRKRVTRLAAAFVSITAAGAAALSFGSPYRSENPPPAEMGVAPFEVDPTAQFSENPPPPEPPAEYDEDEHTPALMGSVAPVAPPVPLD